MTYDEKENYLDHLGHILTFVECAVEDLETALHHTQESVSDDAFSLATAQPLYNAINEILVPVTKLRNLINAALEHRNTWGH